MEPSGVKRKLSVILAMFRRVASGMSEAPDKPEDQPSGQPQPDEEERPQLRKVPEDELRQVLEAHDKWVQSEGKEGEQANLEGTNLRGAILRGANLEGAILRGANLEGANLRQANLQGANLEGAILRKAELQGAKLNNANLSGAAIDKANLSSAALDKANLSQAVIFDANLSEAKLHTADLTKTDLRGAIFKRAILINTKLREARLDGADLATATGLLSEQFSDTSLTGAALPDAIAEFEGLAHVEEISKNARKIFLSTLLGCAYAWLTIATTTDARLLTNSASSPLPIIQTEIPIAGFYWAAPFILMGIYVYLHFYLERLWHSLGELPARFPDGKRLDERAYPWLLNGLVRRHFALLKEDRPPIAKMEELVTIFLAWWVVPATLLGFWLRYLPRHEWWGTGLHIGLLLVSAALAIIFYRSGARTLRGEEPQPFGWKTFWRGKRTYQGLGFAGLAVVVFSFLSILAIQGGQTIGMTITPLATANLREADVSTKPENWRGEEKDIPLVKGASLRGRDLRYADAFKAFLANGNLKGANLQGAFLVSANLQQADLEDADLRRASLTGANLQGAILGGAKLQGADLSGANLQGADLGGAKLQGASLILTELQGANLLEAKLQGTNLKFANGLTQKQLDYACGNAKTKLPPNLSIKRCP